MSRLPRRMCFCSYYAGVRSSYRKYWVASREGVYGVCHDGVDERPFGRGVGYPVVRVALCELLLQGGVLLDATGHGIGGVVLISQLLEVGHIVLFGHCPRTDGAIVWR